MAPHTGRICYGQVDRGEEMTHQEFIQQVAYYVQQYAPQYDIAVHSPIIAQAIIESGWGKSKLASTYHNYFGLTCGSGWDGKSVHYRAVPVEGSEFKEQSGHRYHRSFCFGLCRKSALGVDCVCHFAGWNHYGKPSWLQPASPYTPTAGPPAQAADACSAA